MSLGQRTHRPSSYHINDPKAVFEALGLRSGDVLLDLGCGAGDYALRASGIVGGDGKVYAVDSDADSIEHLRDRVRFEGIGNVDAIQADATKRLPLADDSIDVCLLSTVLHNPVVKVNSSAVFQETIRVLKTNGRLFVIECGDKDPSFGPPASMRISPEEMEMMAVEHGYVKIKTVDLGFNYLMEFRKMEP